MTDINMLVKDEDIRETGTRADNVIIKTEKEFNEPHKMGDNIILKTEEELKVPQNMSENITVKIEEELNLSHNMADNIFLKTEVKLEEPHNIADSIIIKTEKELNEPHKMADNVMIKIEEGLNVPHNTTDNIIIKTELDMKHSYDMINMIKTEEDVKYPYNVTDIFLKTETDTMIKREQDENEPDTMSDDMLNAEEELEETNLRKRVGLFKLNTDSKWSELGIGQVATYYVEKMQGTYLVVMSENDDSLILQSKILIDTAYKKEQDRFIIWTQIDTVYGLSFQENAGCDDIWKIICQVQGKDPSLETTQANIKQEINPQDIGDREQWFEEMLDIEHTFLSPYERDVLGQLIELVNRLVSPVIDDKIPYTSKEDRQLLDLFRKSEDIKKTEDMQQMNEIISYLSTFKRRNQ